MLFAESKIKKLNYFFPSDRSENKCGIMIQRIRLWTHLLVSRSSAWYHLSVGASWIETPRCWRVDKLTERSLYILITFSRQCWCPSLSLTWEIMIWVNVLCRPCNMFYFIINSSISTRWFLWLPLHDK